MTQSLLWLKLQSHVALNTMHACEFYMFTADPQCHSPNMTEVCVCVRACGSYIIKKLLKAQ